MEKIKGQDKLLNTLLSYDSLPHTILLCGDGGCGKHSVANILCDNYKLSYYELTKDDCNFERLCEISSFLQPTLCFIDIDKFKEQQQNTILKFIEEPSQLIYIIISTTSLSSVLNTIKGRCQVYQFETYTKEFLSQFTGNKELLNYCSTPGQLLTPQGYLEGLIDYCKSIDQKISNATLGNILSIADKMPDTYSYEMFMKTLLKNMTDIESYKRVLQGIKDFKTNVNKKWYLETMLLELKFIKREYDIRRAENTN